MKLKATGFPPGERTAAPKLTHLVAKVLLGLLVLAAVGCHHRAIRKPATTCPAPHTACPGTSGQAICADLQTDVVHCGGCGVSCGPGEECVQGQCAGYCPAPYASCPDATGKPVCRDLRVDADNCGTCGLTCPGGQACSQGKCGLQCAPPQTLCPSSPSSAGFCANLQNDRLHCGACDLICPGDRDCVEGRCGACRPNITIPGGVMLLDFGVQPSSPLIADLDNDGVLDLVALSASENTVTVRLGQGDGSFSERLATTTGEKPKVVRVGDFDGDGRPDLAVANTGSQDLVILLGMPEGRSWRESQRLKLTSVPLALAVGDLDQDGREDLVVGLQGQTAGELWVRLSSQDGIPSEPIAIPLQGTPSDLVLTDLDGDQRPDFVVALQEGSVAVALTGPDGRPGPLRRFATGPGCAAVLAVDLDHDSRLDLVTSSTGDNSLRVLAGQGDGSFAQAVRYQVAATPAGLFAADLDGDGNLDVLTGAPAEHSVRVFPGLRDGTLGPAKSILAGSSPVEIGVADLNGDKLPDVVAAHAREKGRTLSVVLARDTGLYAPRTQTLTDSPLTMRMADLDGDGQQDLLLLGSKLSVMRGLRDGSFAPPTVYDMGTVAAVDLEILDLNQDSRPDVAVATTKALLLFLNEGAGRLATPKTVPVTPTLYSFAAGDLNHDGRPDFATDNNYGIDLLMATASGDYQSKSLIYNGICGCDYRPSMRLLDLNRDGHLDLLTLRSDNSSSLEAWMGDGTGTLTKFSLSASVTGLSPRILGVTTDKNQPGVMLVDRGGTIDQSMKMGSVTQYRGPGDGTLSQVSASALGGLVGDGTLVDFDQDGVEDALVPATTPMGLVSIDGRVRVRSEYAASTDNSVAIFRSMQSGGLTSWMRYWLDSPASAVGAADLNGDGSVDIVAAHDAKPGLTILLTKATPCR